MWPCAWLCVCGLLRCRRTQARTAYSAPNPIRNPPAIEPRGARSLQPLERRRRRRSHEPSARRQHVADAAQAGHGEHRPRPAARARQHYEGQRMIDADHGVAGSDRHRRAEQHRQRRRAVPEMIHGRSEGPSAVSHRASAGPWPEPPQRRALARSCFECVPSLLGQRLEATEARHPELAGAPGCDDHDILVP